MRSTIFSTLLALIIASIVQAISLDRTLEIRQNTPVSNPPRFINDDGTIDIANLVAVSRIVPNNVPPTLPTNTTVNTSSSLNDVIQQAKAEQQIPQAAKRTLLDGCSTKINLPSTLGNLFVPQALTPSLFSGWPTFTSSANKANSTVANGNYTQVYKNVQATYLNPSVNSFLGMSTLWSYDVETCAARCTKLTGCMSFEVGISRLHLSSSVRLCTYINSFYSRSITNVILPLIQPSQLYVLIRFQSPILSVLIMVHQSAVILQQVR